MNHQEKPNEAIEQIKHALRAISIVKILSYGVVDGDSSKGIREPSDEEKRNMQEIMDKHVFEGRNNIKDNFGIKSCNHADLNEWLAGIINKKSLETLGKYRHDFAHRLNSLENLTKALEYHPPDFINEVLNNISKVLDGYESCFKNIILYRTSQYYSFHGIYSSLSAEKMRLRMNETLKFFECLKLDRRASNGE